MMQVLEKATYRQLILFKLVFISHCYYESHRGELFFETQCIGYCTLILFTPTSTTLRGFDSEVQNLNEFKQIAFSAFIE